MKNHLDIKIFNLVYKQFSSKVTTFCLSFQRFLLVCVVIFLLFIFGCFNSLCVCLFLLSRWCSSLCATQCCLCHLVYNTHTHVHVHTHTHTYKVMNFHLYTQTAVYFSIWSSYCFSMYRTLTHTHKHKDKGCNQVKSFQLTGTEEVRWVHTLICLPHTLLSLTPYTPSFFHTDTYAVSTCCR